MSEVKIFWDPRGFELDSLGKKKYLRATDGDTPYISVPIRMLSIDTPEIHYPGTKKPSKSDDDLMQLAEWIDAGYAPVGDGLGAHLYPRLATGTAGTHHEEQGGAATTAFEELLTERLTKPNGRKRSVYIRAADQHFDQYGRLLAYMAPSYSKKERETLSREELVSFNLLMVKSGWAATFIIFPSIPAYLDLVDFQEAAKTAYESRIGAWADPLALTGYEFRMCIRLFGITKKLVAGKKLAGSEKYGYVSRFCADMTTREIFYPGSYYRVSPYNRLFVWAEDVGDAAAKLNLLPAGASD